MENAYFFELAAAVAYVVAAVRLLRLSARSRELPERLLGLTFLLIGISYFFYEILFPFESEELLTPFSFIARILWDAGMISLALFNRNVFRARETWAGWLVSAIAVLFVLGIGISMLEGDWEGYAIQTSKGFWFEWVGQVLPLIWVGAEAILEHGRARRRVALGLTDRLICNRYLLWSVFALMGLCINLIVIPQYIEYAAEARFGPLLDGMAGGCAIVSVAAIWLAFFPPAVYRRWLGEATPARAGQG